MRILVTGSSGFLGTCLSKRLLTEGYDVLGYDLIESDICKTVIGDIGDYDKFSKSLKDIDHVFHLAAIANLDFARIHPQIAIDVNVRGTYVVAKSCAKSKVPLSFASTCCVYGNSPEHPSKEYSLCVPTDIYGTTKLVGEEIVRRVTHGNILRFGTTYGPHMRRELAIYIFIKQALQGENLTIHGLGEQTRCFIYIDDLIEATIKVLQNELIGETLNIATPEELSVLDIANIILEETDSEGRFKFLPDREGQIMREKIDILKTTACLDWSPKVKAREGIKRTIKWLKNEL